MLSPFQNDYIGTPVLAVDNDAYGVVKSTIIVDNNQFYVIEWASTELETQIISNLNLFYYHDRFVRYMEQHDRS